MRIDYRLEKQTDISGKQTFCVYKIKTAWWILFRYECLYSSDDIYLAREFYRNQVSGKVPGTEILSTTEELPSYTEKHQL